MDLTILSIMTSVKMPKEVSQLFLRCFCQALLEYPHLTFQMLLSLLSFQALTDLDFGRRPCLLL